MKKFEVISKIEALEIQGPVEEKRRTHEEIQAKHKRKRQDNVQS